MTFDVDAFLEEREGHTASCSIVTKSGLVEELDRLSDELKAAKRQDDSLNRIPEAPKIQARIDEIREEMQESAREFRFKEIPRHLYESLIGECPPRQEDKEAGSMWHAEKFPPLLIAAAAEEPKLTREDAHKLWKGLPFGEARRLWITALAPQGKVGSVPLASSGIGQTPTTGMKSDTADPEESPEASS